MTTWTFTREDGSELVVDDEDEDTPYVVVGFSPYLTADIGSNDQPIVGGEVGASDTEHGRPVTVTFELKDWHEDPRVSDPLAVTEAIEVLDAFFQPSSQLVFVEWEIGESLHRGRWVRCRGLSDETPTEQMFGGKLKLNLRCLDPRVYNGIEFDHEVTTEPTILNWGGRRPTSNWRVEVAATTEVIFTPTLTIDNLPNGQTMVLVGHGTIPIGSKMIFDGRNDEVFIEDEFGVPHWTVVATDLGGRAAVLWPIGPGGVPISYTTESGDGEVTLYSRSCT